MEFHPIYRIFWDGSPSSSSCFNIIFLFFFFISSALYPPSPNSLKLAFSYLCIDLGLAWGRTDNGFFCHRYLMWQDNYVSPVLRLMDSDTFLMAVRIFFIPLLLSWSALSSKPWPTPKWEYNSKYWDDLSFLFFLTSAWLDPWLTKHLMSLKRQREWLRETEEQLSLNLPKVSCSTASLSNSQPTQLDAQNLKDVGRHRTAICGGLHILYLGLRT